MSDWPLDDLRLNQFEGALKLSRIITAAAALYQLLLLFATILSSSCRSRAGARCWNKRWKEAVPVLAIIVTLGLFVLYYCADRDTRRWAVAPLTMFIVFLINVLLQVVLLGVVRTPNASHSAGAGIVFIVMLFFTVVAAVWMKAFMAIPKYLRSRHGARN